MIADRCHQARVVNALEPEWEARFEPRSYGFRPGRGCHDAIQAVFEVVKGRRPKRPWVLDADLAGAFDRIAHDHILAMLGTFPARGMVAQWLKAGVVEQGRLHRTEEGTPQGGVVSPVLLNVALHGMEEAAGVRYHRRQSRSDQGGLPGCDPATPMISSCTATPGRRRSRSRPSSPSGWRPGVWRSTRTRRASSPSTEGFDFLGFNVRRYRGKPLIKPSKAAVRRIRKRLRTELRSLRGSNAQAVIRKLNPIIRGWAAYYRTQVSSEVVQRAGSLPVAAHMEVGQLQPPEQAEALGRSPGTTASSTSPGRTAGCSATAIAAPTCHKFAWTRILRHRIVRHGASPDDPALADYWAWRRRKAPLPINKTTQELTDSQDGRCAICRGLLFAVENRPQTPREWEKWLATRTAIITTATRPGDPEKAGPRLIHAECRHGLGPELRDAYEPSGLA